jgi:hypothetical protein
MSTILPENATSWRDLADQLSPQQIERLEELERDPTLFIGRTTESERRAALLNWARREAQDNFADMMFADVAAPSGVTRLDGWTADGERYFSGSSWLVGRSPDEVTAVLVHGTQYPDGSCKREVVLSDGLGDGRTDLLMLSKERARELAQALIDAADEIDGLAVR